MLKTGKVLLSGARGLGRLCKIAGRVQNAKKEAKVAKLQRWHHRKPATRDTHAADWW